MDRDAVVSIPSVNREGYVPGAIELDSRFHARIERHKNGNVKPARRKVT